MTYRLLADLVMVVHFAFVGFAVLGGFAVLWRMWLAWLHLPAVAWAVLISLAGWVCPLTPLEQTLRRQAGLTGYEGGFIEHYIMPVLYPVDMTREVAVLLGVAVLAWNMIIYALAWRRARRGRARR